MSAVVRADERPDGLVNAIEATVALPLAEAEAAARVALAQEGFGVLTEIDVAATLKAKLGVDRPPLKVLGVCNPSVAHRALELDPSVSLLLPCNVVLEPASEVATRVTIADPRQLLGDGRLQSLAEEAAARLERVAARIDEAS
jgi:uncharacterized protein (DUF302 family)